MRGNLLLKSLITAALLILAIPIAASAQVYRDRYYNRYDYRDRYDLTADVRDAINRLDDVSARLENDLTYTQGRQVFGFFQIFSANNTGMAEIRDFRRTVRQLRNSSYNGRDLDRSMDEAQLVLDRGVQLDRYLRLRTGSTNVDADLSELRSNLHIIADAYDLRMPY